MPLLGALLIRQRRMEDGHFIAKHLVQIGGNRRREPDLGNQQDRGAACLEYRAHRGEIDGSLPRPGNAMQQDPAELARCYAFLNLFQRVLLGGVEFEFKRRPARLDAGDVELGRFLDDIDQAALDEGVERGARDVECVKRVDIGTAAGLGQCIEQSLLVRVEFRPAGSLS